MAIDLTPHSTLPTLYTFDETSNPYKVRLLASLLNIKLEHRIVDVQKGQQQSPEYLAINPRGSLPALVHGPHTFYDSHAILTYLAALYPDTGKTTTPSSYWSANPVEQGKIVDWLSFGSSWIQFGVFTAANIVQFQGAYNGVGTWHTPQTLEEAKRRGYRSLDILDAHLAKQQWLALDRPTIGDLAVFISVALAPMGDISYDKYENVKRWMKDIKSLKGFITTKGIEDPLYLRKAAVA